MLPTVDFFGTQITRAIVGDNPVNGHSYIPDMITGEEMKGYYTQEKTLEMLFRAEECGYNTLLPLACPFMLETLHEYRRQGGKLHFIFQPHPATPLETNIDEMMALDPLAIYHQGSTTDYLLETGAEDTLLSNLELLKKTRLPVGLCSHLPEVIRRSEEEKWNVDFYMTCLYNARRDRRGEQSGFITGKTKSGIIFYPNDRFSMFEAIKSTDKPCVAYKILAGGQVFIGEDAAEYPQTIERYIQEAFFNIKAADAICIGVFQAHFDQLAQNADIIKRCLL
ncbi:MAG: hypothetical protein FWH48_04030 [Oscillospiraceae bacterium]|nr:hypothetical protein [Oscillospiraceae bacterium]